MNICLACQQPCGEDAKKYCSNKCQQAYQLDKLLFKWIYAPDLVVSKTGLCSKWIKNFLRDLFDNKCQLCGWNQVNSVTNIVPLEVNHIDGNGNNNRLENLQLICPNCHSLTPNFRALNKKSVRDR